MAGVLRVATSVLSSFVCCVPTQFTPWLVGSSGKTTLVNCLNGLITATYGQAFMFGANARTDMADLRRVMGSWCV